MTDFYKLWTDSDIGREALTDAHSYVVGDDDTTPSFPRIEAYLAAEPLRQDPEWDQWQRVKVRTLLGGERIARTGRGYTVFPADAQINAQIIATASRFFTYQVDERGLPSEEVRDLCSHLAIKGVRSRADGTLTTYFLHVEAAAYLRDMGTKISLPKHRFEKRTTNKTKRTK